MMRMSPIAAVAILLSATALTTAGQQTAPATTAAPPSAYVQLATHETAVSPAPSKASDPRRLGPPSASHANEVGASKPNSLLPQLSIPRSSLSTAFVALAFVVGIFLFVMSLVKRAIPKSMQFLPAEVAAVLGRMPLAGKQFAHLIKLGDKLVLVSISPARIDTITEVTDPNQVARLLAICIPDASPQVRQDYDQILRQLAAESRGGRGLV